MEIDPTKRVKTCVKGLGEGQPYPDFLSLILGVAVANAGFKDNTRLTQFTWESPQQGLWLEEQIIDGFICFVGKQRGKEQQVFHVFNACKERTEV